MSRATDVDTEDATEAAQEAAAISTFKQVTGLDPNAEGLGSKIAGAIGAGFGAIKRWVKDFVWGIVIPIYRGFYWIPIILVGTVAVVFLGTDRELGLAGGWPGIADIPLLISSTLIDGVEPAATMILDSVGSINAELVLAVTDNTGLAAFPLLALIQFVELVVLFYLLVSGVRMARSLPGASTLVAGIDVATRPLRAVVGWFR